MNKILAKYKHYYYLYIFFLLKYFSFKKFFNMFFNLYEYKKRKIVLRSIPFKMHFDVADACVLNCPLCPTGRKDVGRKKAIVDFEKFKKVFDQFKDYLFFIRLYNWGEPFLCPDLFKIVDYCHENNVGVQLHSNLNYYNDEILLNVVKSKIDYLHLSIDGYTQESYEFYRVGGNIQKVFKGMEKIIQLKKDLKSKYPIIHWGYLLNNKNKADVGTAYAYAKKIGVDIFEFHDISLFNSLDDKFSETNYQKYLSQINEKSSCDERKSKSHCNFLWCGITVNPDISYSPCCVIYNASDNFGSFNDDKEIGSVINSPMIVESRKMFKFKNYKSNRITPCDRCEWYTKAK